MTTSSRVRRSSQVLSKISFTFDSHPGVAMTSPAMLESHSKRSRLISAGRMAMESHASSLELNAPPRQ